jgi:hypothetical protein
MFTRTKEILHKLDLLRDKIHENDNKTEKQLSAVLAYLGIKITEEEYIARNVFGESAIRTKYVATKIEQKKK